MKTQNLMKITLWANRFVAVLVGALVFTLPTLTLWYCGLLDHTPPIRDYVGVLVCFYCCAIAIFIALWNLEKVMQNLLQQRIFIRENVKRIRIVQWCCGIVALICLIAVFFFLLMIVLVAITGFLFLVVGVVASVLDGAVALQEESDLTI